MRITKRSEVFAILVVAMSLHGCDSTGQLPNGAQVRISPGGHSIDITQVTNSEGGCLFNPSNYVDTPLVLSVHDGEGSPIGGAQLNVTIEYSGNTFLGPEVLALYEDNNSNGVVDEETELVSGRDSDGFVGNTREFSGDKHMFLRINLSCPYKSNLYVTSQFAYNVINIEVNATNVVTVEPSELTEPDA